MSGKLKPNQQLAVDRRKEAKQLKEILDRNPGLGQLLSHLVSYGGFEDAIRRNDIDSFVESMHNGELDNESLGLPKAASTKPVTRVEDLRSLFKNMLVTKQDEEQYE